MAVAQKSNHLHVDVPEPIDRAVISRLVERAAVRSKLIISLIGGYSRVKYPNSIHWHFKRDWKEPGLIDATYWAEGSKFWLIVRHREPKWVHDTAPRLQDCIQAELNRAPHSPPKRDGAQ